MVSPASKSTRRSRIRTIVGVSGWNFLVASGADLGTKAMGLAATVVLARVLQPSGFGVYNTILAFVAIGLALGNLGLDRLLLRELSGSLAPLRLYATARAVRSVAALSVVVGMTLYAFVSGYDVLPWLIGGLALYPALSSALLTALFQARERFGIPARAALTQALLNVAGVGICALVGAPLVAYLGVVVAAEGGRQLYLYTNSRQFDWPEPSVEWNRLLPLLRSALPYAVLTLLGIVYLRIDLVMLEALAGETAAGLYAGATRILMVTNAIPGLCMSVLFPRFVRLQASDSAGSARLYLLAVRLLVWAGVGTSVLFVLAARPVMVTLYGDAYVGGASALQWLMVALLFMFWHAPNGTVLFSSDRLRSVVLISCGTAAFNVIANLYAIPRWGVEGAAATTAASELLSFLLFTPLVCRRLNVGPATYARSALTLWLSRADRRLLLDVRT